MVEAPSDENQTIRMKVFSEDDKAVILSTPSTLPALPAVAGSPLRFAPGEAAPPYTFPVTKPRKRARHRTYSDLFDFAVIGLIIVCATVCAYRIFWAIQP